MSGTSTPDKNKPNGKTEAAATAAAFGQLPPVVEQPAATWVVDREQLLKLVAAATPNTILQIALFADGRVLVREALKNAEDAQPKVKLWTPYG